MNDLAEIHALAARHAGKDCQTFPRLKIYTLDHPTELMALVYEPVACLIVQGRKRTIIGDQVFEYGAGDCMVVAAEIAVLGQISEASPKEPYLAINLYLDPKVISDLLVDLSAMPEPPAPSGYRVETANAALVNAWFRLAEVLDRPEEIPVLAHHREHELMFRLLMSAHGGLLRQIAGADSRLSLIRRALAWIRTNYAEHLSVEAMAKIAGMSVSVFHRHFKAVTGLSPLQYQKQIRLYEARRRMVSERAEAATVGFAVGYESASQFSREYRRLFGAPPRRDVAKLQALADAGL